MFLCELIPARRLLRSLGLNNSQIQMGEDLLDDVRISGEDLRCTAEGHADLDIDAEDQFQTLRPRSSRQGKGIRTSANGRVLPRLPSPRPSSGQTARGFHHRSIRAAGGALTLKPRRGPWPIPWRRLHHAPPERSAGCIRRTRAAQTPARTPRDG
jgi:hypothetical protein